MKVRNKHTGEINILKVDEDYFNIYKDDGEFVCPVTLKELNDGWEDYEEPKEYYFIADFGGICARDKGEIVEDEEDRKSIGNYFETKEEAEKAVEKLKAWKRLKDKGFRFDGWDENHHNLGIIEFSFDKVKNNVWDFEKDLDLLFGGEE